MAVGLYRPSNGVSFGAIHTITAQDATDNSVTIDFQVNYDIVAVLQIVDASNVVVDLADAVITYPAKGQVRIADGTTYNTVAGRKISVIAQRATAKL